MAGVLREGPDRPRRSGYGRWCEQASCPRRATRARWHGRACRVIGAACSVSAAGAVDDRLADAGVRLLLKREDPINLEVPGNKWRKLKYNLAEAERSGHRTLLTFGGAYSNHIRATAAAGELFGFTTIGVIRGEQHLPLNESLSYAVQRGMRLTYLDRATYRQKHDPAVIDRLRKTFGDFYLVPEGGSNGPDQQASPLAARPYDLRHAAVSLWLNAGVPAPTVARRAGHSVEVLLRVYAACIDGEDELANTRISGALA